MTPKQEALVKDLAALFVKYRISDWRIVIAALSNSPAVFGHFADIIEKLAANQKHSKNKIQKRKNDKIEAKPTDHEARDHVIHLIEKKLFSLKTSDNSSIYRKLLIKTGTKVRIPNSSSAIIREIAIQLAQLSPEELRRFFETADIEEVDMHKDYQRWIRIISGNHQKE